MMPKKSSSVQDEWIEVKGAREHNLKNISLKIPRNKIVTVTGLSGSGKSSLVFDTVYAEGQRRYLESLSTYARQFLEKLKKPDVDYIGGLSPSVAIDQKQGGHNPRSTVATTTEIFDYLRLLFAKAGHLSQKRDQPSSLSTSQAMHWMNQNYKGHSIQVLASVVRGRKGEYQKLFEDLLKKGFDFFKIDGKETYIESGFKLKKNFRHDIEVIVDEFLLNDQRENRLEQALEHVMDLSEGSLGVIDQDSKKREPVFLKLQTGEVESYFASDLTPNLFSFNSPYGACPTCRGMGRINRVAEKEIIANENKAVLKGALNEDVFFSFNRYFIEDLVYDISKKYGFEPKIPFKEWTEEHKEVFFFGDDELSGLSDEWKRLLHETKSENVRKKIRKFLKEDICPSCNGKRLKKESLDIKINGLDIIEMTQLSVEKANEFFYGLEFSDEIKPITDPILKEIQIRVGFLNNVGLGYLGLDRVVHSLSGGELQRIRLAAQLGIGLTGVLYVLDEPSIGLHSRDHEKLLKTLEALRDQGNSVLIVEHDEETIRRSDFVVDLGPGAGLHGGEILAHGSLSEMKKSGKSITMDYLLGKKKVCPEIVEKDYKKAKKISLKGCAEHNLKNIDVDIPLGNFVCVTGVSGSGKSTLVHDILYKEMHNRLWKTSYRVGDFKKMVGAEEVDKLVEIDQSPIGRTPRSTPATYIDLFGMIRNLMSQMEASKLRNYKPARFSFNVKGGRCEECRGEGVVKLEMSFMSDVYVLCEKCDGRRYLDSTLEIEYQGKNIADILEMSVSEALEFFDKFSNIKQKLLMLEKLGLGYIKLGQPSTTLSGGEAQRIKLAAELCKKSTGKTLYLLDEPTTGLHFSDVGKLLEALLELRDQGNTVLVIEHQMDVIGAADYIIDLGPEGGEAGGELVFQGSPQELVKFKGSFTGKYLKEHLSNKG